MELAERLVRQDFAFSATMTAIPIASYVAIGTGASGHVSHPPFFVKILALFTSVQSRRGAADAADWKGAGTQPIFLLRRKIESMDFQVSALARTELLRGLNTK